MSVNREQLHNLIDVVDVSEYEILYHLLFKFIPEDKPMPDEIEAIRIGRDSLERGESVRYEEINWD